MSGFCARRAVESGPEVCLVEDSGHAVMNSLRQLIDGRETMHRQCLNASRNIGLSATLSSGALKVAAICFSGFKQLAARAGEYVPLYGQRSFWRLSASDIPIDLHCRSRASCVSAIPPVQDRCA